MEILLSFILQFLDLYNGSLPIELLLCNLILNDFI